MKIACTLGDRQSQPILSIRGTAKASDLPAKIGEFLGEVWSQASSKGGQVAGMPFTRLHGIDGDQIDLEAGMPVAAAVAGEGRVASGELPAGPAVSADHFGSYETLGDVREALLEWARSKGHEPAGPPWEVYWTDPGQEPDPSKWRTEIVLPLRHKSAD